MSANAARRVTRDLEVKAVEAASLLGLLANERRLIILCQLIRYREMAVGTLAKAVGLSQSALSQHLALLRADRVVGARRSGQMVFYRVIDERVIRLLSMLEALMCADRKAKG